MTFQLKARASLQSSFPKQFLFLRFCPLQPVLVIKAVWASSSVNEGSASGLGAELEVAVPCLWEGRTSSSCQGGQDSKGRRRRKVTVGLGCRMPAVDSEHVSSPVKLEEEVTS